MQARKTSGAIGEHPLHGTFSAADVVGGSSTSCAGGGVLSTTGANIITALNGPLPSNLNEMTVKDLKRHTKPAVAALQVRLLSLDDRSLAPACSSF